VRAQRLLVLAERLLTRWDVTLRHPSIQALDPYSGDFGVGFFGHGELQASYFVQHPVYGPSCYLCDAQTSSLPGGKTVITPRDSVRRSVFIEPLGLMLEVRSGALLSAVYDASARTVALTLHDDGT